MVLPALQAAGHEGAMVSENGAVFIKPSSPKELQFYRHLLEDQHSDLADFTCTFMGTLTQSQDTRQELPIKELPINAESIESQLQMQAMSRDQAPSSEDESAPVIVLENLLYGYKQPNILDVKLGAILYDENASEDKKARLQTVSQTTTSGSMGMRIAGMSVYDHLNKQRKAYDKFFGRNLTEKTIVKGLSEYFPGVLRSADVDKRTDMCEAIVASLQEIQAVLQTKEVSMISSSVLIIYEGDPDEFERKLERNINETDQEHDSQSDSDSDSESEFLDAPLLTVKLIDFAHSEFRPGQGNDKNLLEGLQSLISVFQQLSASSVP